jgi:hypothetical protein
MNLSPLDKTTAFKAGAALAVMIAASTTTAGPVVSAALPQANAAACEAPVSRIDGGPAVNYCGPATATLRVGGWTYSFSHGTCQSAPGLEDVTTLGTFAKASTSHLSCPDQVVTKVKLPVQGP